MSTVAEAVAAIETGELVAYPTETCFGLGADATDADAVEAVFVTKQRDLADPLSVGFPDLATAKDYVTIEDRTEAFMVRNLPGPITVLCEKGPALPSILTAGRDLVGVRIPAHPTARRLFEGVAPVTTTSANISGTSAPREANELDPAIREAVSVVLEADSEPEWQPAEPPAPGTEIASTVVNVETGVIHRRGAAAEAVEAWLEGRPL